MFETFNGSGRQGLCFLETLWAGLKYLYEEVKAREAARLTLDGHSPEVTKNQYRCSFGSEPGDAFVSNCFIWYANSFDNFAGVFSKAFPESEVFIQKISGKEVKQFANIELWRNKVAAHTAWVHPKKNKSQKKTTTRDNEDTRATQEWSIALFPEFSGGHFEIGGWVISPGLKVPFDRMKAPADPLSLYLTHRLSATLIARLNTHGGGEDLELQDALNSEVQQIWEKTSEAEQKRLGPLEATYTPFEQGPSRDDWCWCLVKEHDRLKFRLEGFLSTI